MRDGQPTGEGLSAPAVIRAPKPAAVDTLGAPATDPVALWRHLFGDEPGWLCIASGPCAGGKLAGLLQEFFRWPEDRLVAANHTRTEDDAGREVYHCCHLLTDRQRRKEDSAPVTALYADADGPVNLSVVPPPTASVRSSPGHRHLYWKLSRSLPASQAEDLNHRLTYAIGADRGGWDLTQLLRVPGTTNRKRGDGHVVTIETITSVAYDPDVLDRALRPEPTGPAPSRAAARRPESAGELFFRSARWETLLRHGDLEHWYTRQDGHVDRSRVDQALVMAAINEGRDFESLLAALLDLRNHGGAKVQQLARERGETAARAYLQRGWDSARCLPAAFSGADDARRAVEQELRAITWAIQRRMAAWKGAGGASARAVLEALVALAERIGKLKFGASYRTLAELASVNSITTVGGATRRLERGGWLRRRSRRTRAGATQWQLRLPPALRRKADSLSRRECSGGKTVQLASPPEDDVWRRVFTPKSGMKSAKGLGKTAWVAWNLLATPMTVAQLAATRRVVRRTTQRNVAVLTKHGLAALNDAGRYVKTYPPLDELAAKLGTIGAGAAQRHRHKRDRSNFEAYGPYLKPLAHEAKPRTRRDRAERRRP